MTNEIRLNSMSTPQNVDATDTVNTTTPSAQRHDTLPSVSAAQGNGKDISSLLQLPQLSAPIGPLDLEVLMDALGFQSRRNATRQGLDSITANAAQQKEKSSKAIEQMKENIRKMEEANKLKEIMGILGILAVVVSVIATVATLGTAGPVMAAISIAMLTLSIVSFATDGEISLAAGFAKLGEACGMSAEDSKLFGFIMELVVIIATLGASIGSAISKGAATAGAQVAKGAQTAIKTTTTAAATAGSTVAKEASTKVVDQLNKLAEQAMKNTFKLTKGLVEASKIAKEAGQAAGSFTGMTSSTLSAVLHESLKVLLPTCARKAALIAQIVTSVLTGALSITKGVVGTQIASAESDAMNAKAEARRLEALLLQLREFADMERAMIKAEMERCNALMGAVMNIVHNNNDAQAHILSSSPAMA